MMSNALPDPGAESAASAADDSDMTPDDQFATLRTELETLSDLPVAERVARFEQVNAVLAAELAALDEV